MIFSFQTTSIVLFSTLPKKHCPHMHGLEQLHSFVRQCCYSQWFDIRKPSSLPANTYSRSVVTSPLNRHGVPQWETPKSSKVFGMFNGKPNGEIRAPNLKKCTISVLHGLNMYNPSYVYIIYNILTTTIYIWILSTRIPLLSTFIHSISVVVTWNPNEVQIKHHIWQSWWIMSKTIVDLQYDQSQ